jgi:hypothetical protein
LIQRGVSDWKTERIPRYHKKRVQSLEVENEAPFAGLEGEYDAPYRASGVIGAKRVEI